MHAAARLLSPVSSLHRGSGPVPEQPHLRLRIRQTIRRRFLFIFPRPGRGEPEPRHIPRSTTRFARARPASTLDPRFVMNVTPALLTNPGFADIDRHFAGFISEFGE